MVTRSMVSWRPVVSSIAARMTPDMMRFVTVVDAVSKNAAHRKPTGVIISCSSVPSRASFMML